MGSIEVDVPLHMLAVQGLDEHLHKAGEGQQAKHMGKDNQDRLLLLLASRLVVLLLLHLELHNPSLEHPALARLKIYIP